MGTPIGLRIREIRRNQKLSAKKLGQMVGLSEQNIFDIEKRNNTIDTYTLFKISDALEVNIETFLDIAPELDQEIKDIKDKVTNSVSEPKSEYSTIKIEHKYMRALEEISELKNKIIELQERIIKA